MEFPHVLIADGGWRDGTDAGAREEDERRLFYVGMTRARETLTLGALAGSSNPWLDEIEGDWLLRLRPQVEAPTPEVMARRYRLLTPADLDLGYAGHLASGHPVHAGLAALRTGDRLQARAAGERVLLCNHSGLTLARLSKHGSAEWLPRLPRIEGIRVLAILRRHRDDGDPAFRDRCRSECWEVPLVEVRVGGLPDPG